MLHLVETDSQTGLGDKWYVEGRSSTLFYTCIYEIDAPALLIVNLFAIEQINL